MTGFKDSFRIRGYVEWWMHDKPGGLLIRHGRTRNLITDVGAKMYMQRSVGISGAPAAPVGMKLGTGSTAVTPSGSGSQLTTYLTGSNLVFDSTWPQGSVAAGAQRVQYKCTYGAGVATTVTPITEVVLFNDANANATSLAAATIARALITGGAKDAAAVLTVIWNHDATAS